MANPTIGATTPRIQYTATASQTVFTVPFEFLANADLAVYVNGTLKTLTTDYTLTGANTTGGGSLTFVTGRTAGDIVTILGDLDYSRNTNKYTKFGLLPAEVLEADFDALQVQAKQLARDSQFALRAPLTDIGSPSMTLPVVATRASKVLGFDASGNPAVSASSIAQMDGAVSVINTIAASTSGNAGSVVYTPAGTGAVPTTVQTKLREFISVKDFGAVGDGITDDTAAIQAAINAAIYNNASVPTNGLKKIVRIPAGRYRITDTLHVGYGSSTAQYTSCFIEGDGMSYRATTSFSGTGIIADFNDRPAFNFQGARHSSLRGLTIVGKNYTWIANNLTGASPILDRYDPTNWVDSSFPASADSRYAPYAAVTIDAYSGPAPATAYPAVTYPAFLGSVAQYNKAFSSNVLLEDVMITGFVAGVVNQPGDADGNGDFTTLRRCQIEYCKYGVSVGNGQSRNVGITDSQIAAAYTALTNKMHGRQIGRFCGTISNLSTGALTKVFDFNSMAYVGNLTFLHFYTEDCLTIGTVDSSSSNEVGMKFESCLFNFSGQTDVIGVPAVALGSITANNMPFVFENCVFSSFPSVLVFGTNTLGNNNVTLKNCTMLPINRNSGSVASEYIALGHDGTCGGAIFNKLGSNGEGGSIYYKYIDLSTLAVGTQVICGDVIGSGGRSKILPKYAKAIFPGSDAYETVSNPRYNSSSFIAKSSLSSCSVSGKTLTITFSSRADWQFAQDGPDNGDVIFDDQTGTVWFVRSRTGTTVTAVAQNNYKSDGAGGYVQMTAVSTTTGNLYFSVNRYYSPRYYLRGDSTSGSAILANCARDDGFAAWYDADIAVDDYYYVVATNDAAISPVNTRVTARDQAAGTITLAGNFGRSETRRRLKHFVRKPPANA